MIIIHFSGIPPVTCFFLFSGDFSLLAMVYQCISPSSPFGIICLVPFSMAFYAHPSMDITDITNHYHLGRLLFGTPQTLFKPSKVIFSCTCPTLQPRKMMTSGRQSDFLLVPGNLNFGAQNWMMSSPHGHLNICWFRWCFSHIELHGTAVFTIHLVDYYGKWR